MGHEQPMSSPHGTRLGAAGHWAAPADAGLGGLIDGRPDGGDLAVRPRPMSQRTESLEPEA